MNPEPTQLNAFVRKAMQFAELDEPDAAKRERYAALFRIAYAVGYETGATVGQTLAELKADCGLV